MVEITEAEHSKEKRIKRNEDSLRDSWDNIKCPNIWIIVVPEEDRRKGHDKIFEEIIVENFPNVGKEIATQVQEAQRVPYEDKFKEKHAKTHIKLRKMKYKEKY